VGAHWPTDIAAGLAIGWLGAWMGWMAVGDAAWTQSARMQAIAAALIAVCAGLLFGHPVGLPAATPFRYTLAAVALLLALMALHRALRRWRAERAAPGAHTRRQRDLLPGPGGTERPRPGSRPG
jgi:hypothetical protein